jgi:hypothetical protein
MAREILSLPIGPHMGYLETEAVIRTLKNFNYFD